MPTHHVYLDYAASAPLAEAARLAREGYEQAPYAGANPNSLHTMGRQAARALDSARATIAKALGGAFRPIDVAFTSGGTESNNLALLGLAEGARDRDRLRTQVILSAIEHDSVLDVAPALKARGFEVLYAKPNREGQVTPQEVERLLGRNTALVSLMCANNETGVIQPVAQVAQAAHKAGALMHTDAVQGFCRIPLELKDVDAVSIAAHKIGGPVGIGALACRQRVHMRPQSFGGGQERGLRAGTQDVCGALAFAAAVSDCTAQLAERKDKTTSLAKSLCRELLAQDTGIVASIPYDQLDWDSRLPGIVSVLVPGVDSETLVLECDQAGYEVSAASACSSGSLDASHVLLAMGVPREEALCSLRISFDERVSQETLHSFAQVLIETANRRSARKAR
ncbi:MAG: cysteine desulfurase [Atopobiaceae bacterium]|nr:cysteine desulfurase [Atopobiaceae bacterium]